MKNLEKEEFIKRAQTEYPNAELDFSNAYDVIFGTLTSIVYNTDDRVYVPKIGVLYRKSIPNNHRWMDDEHIPPRYKIAISAKPFKLKKEGQYNDSSTTDRQDR